MDDIHQYTSFIQQLKLLNAFRLYLLVTFTSEITNIPGNTILCGATIGNRTDIPTSKYKWSNQDKHNKVTWKIWKASLQKRIAVMDYYWLMKKVKTMESKQEVISTRDGPGLGGTFCDIGGYNFYFLWIDIKTYKNMSEWKYDKNS